MGRYRYCQQLPPHPSQHDNAHHQRMEEYWVIDQWISYHCCPSFRSRTGIQPGLDKNHEFVRLISIFTLSVIALI